MKEYSEVLRDDDVVRPNDIEILTTDDHRIISIGEVFVSDTERAILCKVCEGLDTALAISKSLELDIGLVVRHLQKLVRIGLLNIVRISTSQKNRPMKIYAPSKMALIIVPSTLMEKFGERSIVESLVNTLLPRLLTVIAFAFTTIGVFGLLNTLFPITGAEIGAGRPDSYLEFIPPVLLSAFIGGIVTLILQMRIKKTSMI